MLRIGVIGGEHKLNQSLQLIRATPNCTLQGFYNVSLPEFAAQTFEKLEDLMELCDAFYILNPLENSELAEQVVRNQKHCIIESPFAASSEAGTYFINLVREADVKIHISNPDRYNDALLKIHPYFQHPVFIESSRLKSYAEVGKSASLVLDLMIHDIDIILNAVKSAVKKVSATGVAVVSTQADIVNARIEFDNGCIANLTASRIHPEAEHKISFYQHNSFLKVDYLQKTSEVFNLDAYQLNKKDESQVLKQVQFFANEEKQNKQNEFEFFVNSVLKNSPVISMANCLNALEIAYTINEKVKNNLSSSTS